MPNTSESRLNCHGNDSHILALIIKCGPILCSVIPVINNTVVVTKAGVIYQLSLLIVGYAHSLFALFVIVQSADMEPSYSLCHLRTEIEGFHSLENILLEANQILGAKPYNFWKCHSCKLQRHIILIPTSGKLGQGAACQLYSNSQHFQLRKLGIGKGPCRATSTTNAQFLPWLTNSLIAQGHLISQWS